MELVILRDRPELLERAIEWFSSKWNVPKEAYRESISDSLTNAGTVPQWYLALDGDTIAAGMGVIENDFHARKDLTPNVCAVFVEPEYRDNGLARQMLNFVGDDMKRAGYSTLYLLTGHTSLYEHFGWRYLCDALEDDGDTGRIYTKEI